MKKKLIIVGVILLLIVGRIVLFNDRYPEEEGQEVTVEPLVERRLATVEVFGTVEAEKVKNIYLDFSARVEEIHVKEGQSIESGDRLLTLDLRDRARRENELRVEEARYEEDKRGTSKIRRGANKSG